MLIERTELTNGTVIETRRDDARDRPYVTERDGWMVWEGFTEEKALDAHRRAVELSGGVVAELAEAA